MFFQLQEGVAQLQATVRVLSIDRGRRSVSSRRRSVQPWRLRVVDLDRYMDDARRESLVETLDDPR